MARTVRTAPEDPRLYRVHVLRTQRLTPHMHRVTVGGDALADFPWMGFDQWFRLFFALPQQESFALPELTAKKWWKEYLAIPEPQRPHCANYTVADHRPGELDIDFVVHSGPDGGPEGRAAIWACGTRPGEQLALLDQGILFDRPDDATEVTLVADESGLPGVAGILRSLPADTIGQVIQEVPTEADCRDLAAPAGVKLSWIVRNDPAVVPGVRALEALRTLDSVHARGYGFVVGESTLATQGRRHLHRIGLPKSRITFSGFWKH